MAVIAPWLVPPNFIQAASAGAEAGLGRGRLLLNWQQEQDARDEAARRMALEQRGQDISESENASRDDLARQAQAGQQNEAGARLKLSYDSLAAQQAQQQQQAAAQSAQTQAVNKLRQSQQDSLAQYRQQQIADQQQKIQDSEMSKTAAQKIQESTADATKSFFKDVQSGKDPETAYENNPGADPKVVHPILTDYLKQKSTGEKVVLPKMDFAVPGQDSSTTSGQLTRFTGVPANDPLINTVLGTNAPPGTGTNYQSAAQRLAAQPQPVDNGFRDVADAPMLSGQTPVTPKRVLVYDQSSGQYVDPNAQPAAPAPALSQ